MKRFYVTAVVIGMLIGVTSTGMAQQRGRGGFGGGGAAGLLMMDEVQKELNITGEQREKLQALRGERGDFENLSREERQKRFEELATKADETIKSVLDEKQQKRLFELRIQREGASSLARAEVADKLGLEAAQKDQIKKIQDESNQSNRIDFQNATQEERQKAFVEFRERREKANEAMLAVLTPAQKEAFEKLQGAKFTFPERQRGGNQ